jgi:deoxyadenosine/deoxycytidine kinase
VIITERSVLTDRYVFAEMLAESGSLDKLEWELYLKWFDSFAAGLPVKGIIYLTTGPETSKLRIEKRGRAGEEQISAEYLAQLDAQHAKWVQSTQLPVLCLSTEAEGTMEGCVERVREFVQLLQAPASLKEGGAGAGALPSLSALGGSPTKGRA